MRISNLRPVSYSFVGRSNRIAGFLAHEFSKSYPAAVIGKKDAVDKEGKPILQQMDKSAVIVDLVKVVVDLAKRVSKLEKSNV